MLDLLRSLIRWCLWGQLCILVAMFALLPQSASAQENAQGGALSRPASVQAQIVGGSDADKGEFPWQALVSAGPFQCGGSLIAPNWVLTAAHCVYDDQNVQFPPGQISVVLGEHNTGSAEASEQERQARSIIVHPDYNNDASNADLALIELNAPAVVNQNAFVESVSLIATGEENLITAGQLATVMGWGATAEIGGPSPQILQKVSVPIVSLKTCRDAYPGQEVTDNMLCAGYVQGGKDACKGDSGGPLVVRNAFGWKQVGIVSWGIGCARAGRYGVYTQVVNYIDWINEEAGLVAPTPTPTFTPSPTPTSTPTPTSPPIGTDTPTPLATATPTPTPTITPMPTSGVSDQNLLGNGDFDNGADGAWTENSVTFNGSANILILELLRYQDKVAPHSGDYAVWLGGADLENGNLTQSVNIPSALPVTLSYFYQIRAQDECGNDSVTISVNNAIIDTIDLCIATETSNWKQATIDISNYSGQFVTLAFNVVTDDFSPQIGNDSAASNFFLDDVSLTSGIGAIPTLAPTLTPTPDVTQQTPVPTPINPTSTPPPVATDVILNNGFENASDGAWVEDSAIYGGSGSLITSVLALPQSITPYEGSYIAWLGGANSETSLLSQDITLPSNAESVAFYYQTRSSDVCGFDKASVLIQQTNLIEFPLCAAQETDEWQLQTINVSQFAGEAVNMTFRLVSDNLLKSNWFIDQIVVTTSSKPQIAAEPEALEFIQLDDNPVVPTSLLINTGDTTVWSVTAESDGWLKAETAEGKTTGAGATTIQVGVDASSLRRGTYEGSISIRAQAALVTVPVSFEVMVDSVNDASPDVIPLTVESGISSLALEWGIPRSSEINQYQVYRRSGQNFELIDTTEEPRIRDRDDNLTPGESYCYRVEGVNAPFNIGTTDAPPIAVSEVACATYSQLSLWIPKFIAAPASTVAIPVNVTNADGLQIKESELWIDYNTTIISITGVSPSAGLSGVTWSFEDIEINNATRRIKARGVANDDGTNIAFYGDGPLFYLNGTIGGMDGDRDSLNLRDFITGIGGSTMSIADESEAGQSIALALTDGRITVQEFGINSWGDIDGNGSPTTRDTEDVLDFATGRTSPDENEFNAAEVNGTGAIEAADATRIFYYAVNGVWPPLDVTSAVGAVEGTVADGDQQEDIVVTVSDADAASGELVNVLIESSELNNFAGGDFVLIYNPGVIAGIESISLGGKLSGFLYSLNTNVPGRIALSIAGPREIDDVGVIALIQVQMAELTTDTVSPLRFADAKLNNLNGRDLVHSFADRTLTLESGVVTVTAYNGLLFLPFIVE